MNQVRGIHLIFWLCLLAIAGNAFAEPAPKNVSVVNTPTVNVNGPVPVTIENGAQTVAEWRIVGATTTETTGRIRFGNLQGYVAMNALCAAEVAPNARACTSSEVAKSIVPSGAFAGWVIPSNVEVVVDTPGDRWEIIDTATGTPLGVNTSDFQNAAHNATCRGFTDGSPQLSGMHFSGASGLETVGCSATSIQILCCAPVAIPVSPLE